MTAIAGRVRMPTNNRVHNSVALQTHGVWQIAIGYDHMHPTMRTRRAPHNLNQVVMNLMLRILLKRKVNGKSKVDNEESEEGEENDSSDADANSKIEKLIAQRYGKKVGSKRRVSRKRKMDDDSNSDDSGKRKKRGISKKRKSVKRGSSDSEDGDEGRRKSDESSDEEDGHWRHRRQNSRNEKGRRRSRRHSDDSDSDVSKDYGRSLSVVAAAVLGQLLRHRLFEV
ncbi:hypothetical protein QYF36_013052 [Acer negundo]|nr:hypothetical protein QYF36_013052 [Acer negundo]